MDQQQQSSADGGKKSSNLTSSLVLVLVKSVVSVWDWITLPLYFLVQRPWLKRAASTKINAQWTASTGDHQTECPVWTRCEAPASSHSLASHGARSLSQLFERSVALYENEPGFGFRPVLEQLQEQAAGKRGVVKVRLADQYHWLTFGQMGQRVRHLARALVHQLHVRPGHHVVIFMETRLEWMLVAQALFRVKACLVTLYATLGEEGVALALDECQPTLIITSSGELVKKLVKLWPKLLHSSSSVKHVIVVGHPTSAGDDRTRKEQEEEEEKALEEASQQLGTEDGPHFVHFGRLELDGQHLGDDNDNSSSSDEEEDEQRLAMIMYTSGSTGAPKGVLLSHGNLLTTLRTLTILLQQVHPDHQDDSQQPPRRGSYAAFLPLAHIMELLSELSQTSMGVAMGYSSPLTLSDASPGLARGTRSDMAVLQPDFFCGVPLILDRIRKGVEAQMVSASSPWLPLPQLLSWFVQYKTQWNNLGYDTPLLDRLVVQRLRTKVMGGKVRAVFTGGAPLSAETQNFTKACFGVYLAQGWGATETTGMSTVMDPLDTSTGRCGPPSFGSQVKLVPWQEGNYRPSDRPNPRGELVVGGPAVALGYYNNAQATEDSFSTDGKGVRWFATGDIGEFFPDGTLKIIDRKKDLVKLQMGEYISLGKVESQIKSSCPLVDEICVYCDSRHNCVIALVVANRKQLQALSPGEEELDWSQLCAKPGLADQVQAVIQRQALQAGLLRLEIPRKVALVSEEWTPASALVTAGLKLRRKQLSTFYKDTLDALYAACD